MADFVFNSLLVHDAVLAFLVHAHLAARLQHGLVLLQSPSDLFDSGFVGGSVGVVGAQGFDPSQDAITVVGLWTNSSEVQSMARITSELSA